MINEAALLGLVIGFLLTIPFIPFIVKKVYTREDKKREEYSRQFNNAIDEVREDINRQYRVTGRVKRDDLTRLTKQWHRTYPKVAFVINHDGEVFGVTIKNATGMYTVVGHFIIPPQFLTANWVYKV